MAASLWPVLYRLCELLPLKKQLEAAIRSDEALTAIRLRSQLNSMCAAVHIELSGWRPAIPPSTASTREVDTLIKVATERKRLESIMNSAKAYQHSAFVYLYRTIHGHPRGDTAVQHHAHLSLLHCEAAVRNGGPMGSLLWPLFVAACETSNPNHHELAERTFASINKRQGMKNIAQSWDIVQSIWQDAGTDVKIEVDGGLLRAGNGLGEHADVDGGIWQVRGNNVVLG